MNTYGESIFGNEVHAGDPAVPAVSIMPSLVSSLDTPKPVVVQSVANPLPTSLVVAGAPIQIGGHRGGGEYGRGLFGGRVPFGGLGGFGEITAAGVGNISFAPCSAVLGPDSTAKLQAFKTYAATNQAFTKFRIEGHADASGNPAANLSLSQDRAMAVVEWLVANGVPASKLLAVAFGSGTTKQSAQAGPIVAFQIAQIAGKNIKGQDPTGGGTVVTSRSSGGYQVSAEGGAPTGTSTTGGAAPDTKGSNTMLYIGLAVGAVAIGGGIWWKMSKKKPAAVAAATPNRRRRRRYA
jgi:outer membrane protein OmpA-like peptidoglycan-associated protein